VSICVSLLRSPALPDVLSVIPVLVVIPSLFPGLRLVITRWLMGPVADHKKWQMYSGRQANSCQEEASFTVQVGKVSYNNAIASCCLQFEKILVNMIRAGLSPSTCSVTLFRCLMGSSCLSKVLGVVSVSVFH